MKRLRFKHTSLHQRIEVYDDRIKGREVRRLYLDAVEHSAIDRTNPNRPVWIYTDFVHLAWIFKSSPRSVLVAGLGGGVMPMSLRRKHSDLTIDVVEIDPVVADVSRKYFHMKEDARMRIHVGDARHFLKETKQRFDIILLDVFKSKNDDLWLPPALASKSFFNNVSNRLSEKGVVVLNLIGRLRGKASATLKIVGKLEGLFPQVYLFPIFLKKAPNLAEERNILVVCTRDGERVSARAIQRRARLLASESRSRFLGLPEYAENYYELEKQRTPN